MKRWKEYFKELSELTQDIEYRAAIEITENSLPPRTEEEINETINKPKLG